MSSPAIGYSVIRRPDVPPIRGITGDPTHVAACRNFLNSQIRYYTTKRTELERQWNRARLFDAGKQWIRPMLGWGGSRYWFQWEPVKVTGRQDSFPRPVRNIFSPAIQDEVSRLVGVGSKPYVRVDDPDAEDGAILAKRLLHWRNEQDDWDPKNRRGCYQAAMFGQWVQSLYWASSKLRAIEDPVTTATRCPKGCDFMMSQPQITGGEAAKYSSGLDVSITGEGQQEYGMSRCPKCGDEMEPYAPREDVWRGGKDSFDRPMSTMQPTGEELSSNVSPYGFFPQNQGIGYELDTDMREFTLRTPRDLMYLEEYYEDGGEVKAERQFELFKHHPVLTGGYGLTIGAEGVWDNHALEDIYVGRPSVKFPRGRMFVMAGDRLLFDGELMIPGTDIPRLDVSVAQWELRDNEIWGKPLGEDLFSPQVNTNSTLSQAMDIQQKHVSPKVILHEGMHLQFAGGAKSAYAGDIWTLQTRGIPPETAARFPFLFGHQGAPSSVWQMLDNDRDYIPTATGARGAEVGDVSGVEAQNYSALLFAAQKSATRRKPRQASFRRLKKNIWTRRLEMAAALYTDERLMHFKDDSNKWHVETVRGTALKGQTTVILEEEPIVDSATASRASIQQAIEWQTLSTSANGGSYSTDRRINRAINLPEELTEERNVQEDIATQEWKEFVDPQLSLELGVDQAGDNHQIHFNNHSIAIDGSQEAKGLRQELLAMGIPWSKILHATWEWERMLSDLERRIALVRSAPDPQGMLSNLVETGVDPLMAVQRVQQMQEQLEKMRASIEAFPPAMELRIYAVWMRLIDVAQIRGKDGRPTITNMVAPLKKLVRFNAHRLAHLKLASGYVPADAPTPGPPAMGPGPAPPQLEAGAAPPPPSEPGQPAQAGPQGGQTQQTAAPAEAPSPGG